MKKAFVAPFSWLFWLSAGMFAIALAQQVHAQAAPVGPTAAAPGAAGGAQQPVAAPGSAQQPVTAQSPSAPQPSAASQPPGASKAPAALVATKPAPVNTFSILEYDVDGNTLLPTPDVERAVMSHMGENKSLTDIEAARVELEKLYHDRGYKTVVVNIPPQRVADGVVRLHVSESPVGKLHIAGSKYHSLRAIRDKVKQVQPGAVPDFPELQKELAEVNQNADLRVTPVLKASETPGKVDVDLVVQDTLPFHASLEVNNRYNAQTTKLRTTGELRYDNLFQRGQSISAQYQIAPERLDDAKVLSVSYVAPILPRLVLAVYGVHNDSNIAAIGDLNVIGKGDIFGLRLISPLPTESPTFYHSFTGGLDYKSFKQNVLVQSSGDTVASPADYPEFVLQYSATWLADAPQGDYLAATGTGRSATTFDAGLSFTIRGLGTDRTQFADKRAGASDSFMIFHPGLQREQIIWHGWSWMGRVEGQFASGPLINNEQFPGGGADSVRGYVEAERLGDTAVRGSMEVRTPQLLNHSFKNIDRSYVFLYADAANLRTLQPLPGQEATFTLASAGIGLRFHGYGFTVDLDGARTFKDGFVTPAKRYRGLFQLIYSY